MKLLIHAANVNCNHPHVHESYDLKNVTCSACKHAMMTYPEIATKFKELQNIEKFNQKKRIADLDKKIAKNSLKGLLCLKCLGKMDKRYNKTTDQYFFGCSKYPNCTFTLPYTLENQMLYKKKIY